MILVLAVAIEQAGLDLGVRTGEPGAAQATDPDGEVPAVERHRRHHARSLDTMPRVGGRFGRRHRQSQEEIVVFGQGGDGLLDGLFLVGGDVDHERHQLAEEQQRRRRAAAVHLIAHMKGALHDRLQRNAAGPPHRVANDRRHLVVDEEQPVANAVVIDAVVQAARIGALVHVAEAGVAMRGIGDHEDRHRRSVDAGQRSDGTEIMTATDHDVARRETGFGFLAIRCQTFEQRTADDRVALSADIVWPGEGWAGGQDRVRGQVG